LIYLFKKPDINSSNTIFEFKSIRTLPFLKYKKYLNYTFPVFVNASVRRIETHHYMTTEFSGRLITPRFQIVQ